MANLPPLGSTTCWVWARAQALALMPAGQVRALLLDGYWQVLFPGIYADAGCEPTAEQWAYAAVLASGGHTGQPVLAKDRGRWRAVAMGRSAARVYGWPLIDDDDPATEATQHLLHDVAVRGGRRTLIVPSDDGPPRELHRHRPGLAPMDVVRRSSGLLLTSRLRTLFDLASLLTHEALVCVIDHVLHKKALTLKAMTAYAEQQRWQPGAPAFRAALAVADGRAESPHETLVRLLLLPVLPNLQPQVKLYERNRLIARLDLGDERVRFAVEADGRAGHAGQAMLAKDRRRDRGTSRLGWHTERVTWFEVRREPVETRARVVTEYQRRAGT